MSEIEKLVLSLEQLATSAPSLAESQRLAAEADRLRRSLPMTARRSWLDPYYFGSDRTGPSR